MKLAVLCGSVTMNAAFVRKGYNEAEEMEHLRTKHSSSIWGRSWTTPFNPLRYNPSFWSMPHLEDEVPHQHILYHS
jgi:hypothetical protein